MITWIHKDNYELMRNTTLTVDIQAVMADPFLSHECWVGSLTAESSAVVLPLHGKPYAVGHAHRLSVLLLRHHTWEADGWRNTVFSVVSVYNFAAPAVRCLYFVLCNCYFYVVYLSLFLECLRYCRFRLVSGVMIFHHIIDLTYSSSQVFFVNNRIMNNALLYQK